MEACTKHSSVHFQQCAMIEFLAAEGVSPIEIHCRMHVVYGNDCVDMSTVHHWAKQCQNGEMGSDDLCDKQWSGWPVTATNEFHKKNDDGPPSTQNAIAALKTLKQRLRVQKHKKNILLQHDNGRPHTLQTIMETIEKLNLTILPHPHIVQTLHYATSTFSQKWRKTFLNICMTQMKRWKGLSGPGWKNKVWSSFVTASRNSYIVGRSMTRMVVIMWRNKYRW